MAKRIVGLELVYTIFILFPGAAIAFGNSRCGPVRQETFQAAENRALREFAYRNKTVRSRVICGRECSLDERCKSFNFYKEDQICELNHATRIGHLEDFSATQGSVYFDADEDTPLFSLDDHYMSCKMLSNAGHRLKYGASGIYTIYPGGLDGDDGLRVYCDMETDGGGWIVFQRRQDDSVDFYRGWSDYQFGFGNLSGEFWLGNDNLVTLTSDDSQGTWELRVDLEDWDGNTAWTKYTDFKISPGEYNLNYDQYDASSTAGDSLEYSKGFPYTTVDRDNDKWPYNCADHHKGAWWFNGDHASICMRSHLNGQYYPDEHPDYDWGVHWYHWKLSTTYSLKKCSMKIRETLPIG